MADVDASTVTMGAQASAAATAGTLWGIFAAGFLFIVSLFGMVLAPFMRKGHTAISEKINVMPHREEAPQKTQTPRVSKAQREFERQMAELNTKREQAELQERLAKLSKKAAKLNPATPQVQNGKRGRQQPSTVI